MIKRKFKKGQKVFRWQWSPQSMNPRVESCTILGYPKDYAGPVCKVELKNGLTIIEGESELFLTKEEATTALINHIAWHIDMWDKNIEEHTKAIDDRRKWISEANQNIHQLTRKD